MADRPSRLPWPTREEVEAARDYKRRFGNVNEQMIEGRPTLNPDDERQPWRLPQGLLADVLPVDRLDGRSLSQVTSGLLGDRQQIDQPTADALHAAQIAAQRSPLGTLGFDASRISPTPATDPGDRLSHGGAYNPGSDRMWVDTRQPSAAVHESMHRAFKLLALPKDTFSRLKADGSHATYPTDEETFVRALMLRHHGDLEMGGGKEGDRQVELARRALANPAFVKQLDRFERLAGEEIARRNLERGPL